MKLRYLLESVLAFILLTGAFQNSVSADIQCAALFRGLAVGPGFRPLLKRIQTGVIKTVPQLLTDVENSIISGSIRKEPNHILSVADSADLLSLLLEVAPQPMRGFESNPLKGYEEQLVEIGIDHRAVDLDFLVTASQNLKLSQGSDLVSFLSSLEFSVDRAIYRSQVDGTVMRKWVTGLINPIRREFAEQVTKSGFALPSVRDRLNTQIELTSTWYSNLGGAYKTLILRSSPVSVSEINLLKAVINLTDYKTFNSIYRSDIMSKPITIAQLADLFAIPQEKISAYIRSQKRTSEVSDLVVNTGGSDMKSEILRGALKDLIQTGAVNLPVSALDPI